MALNLIDTDVAMVSIPEFMLALVKAQVEDLQRELERARTDSERAKGDARYFENLASDRRQTIQNMQEEAEAQAASVKAVIEGAFTPAKYNGLALIPAIKALRIDTRMGLREAKQQIEEWVLTGKLTLENGDIPTAALIRARDIIEEVERRAKAS